MKYFLTSLVSIILSLSICYLIDKSENKSENIKQQKSIFSDRDLSSKLNNQFLKSPDNMTSSTFAADENNAILAVIYKRKNATWFIKAKGESKIINSITTLFNKFFIDELTFTNEKPNLSLIPKKYIAVSKSTLRYASYMINNIDISITRLAGQQDTYANVRRWMTQVGLNDNSKIKMEFRDDKKTILVRIPRD